jgi:hypothetical protein
MEKKIFLTEINYKFLLNHPFFGVSGKDVLSEEALDASEPISHKLRGEYYDHSKSFSTPIKTTPSLKRKEDRLYLNNSSFFYTVYNKLIEAIDYSQKIKKKAIDREKKRPFIEILGNVSVYDLITDDFNKFIKMVLVEDLFVHYQQSFESAEYIKLNPHIVLELHIIFGEPEKYKFTLKEVVMSWMRNVRFQNNQNQFEHFMELLKKRIKEDNNL